MVLHKKTKLLSTLPVGQDVRGEMKTGAQFYRRNELYKATGLCQPAFECHMSIRLKTHFTATVSTVSPFSLIKNVAVKAEEKKHDLLF